jgi:hypothetical protein
MSPVKYELGFYIPEDGILHSHCSENLNSYMNFMNIFMFSLNLNVRSQCRLFTPPLGS